jgi:hypothetical protein
MKFHLAIITGLALISPFATVATHAVTGRPTPDGTDYSPLDDVHQGNPKIVDTGLDSRTMEAIADADAAAADAGIVGTPGRRELWYYKKLSSIVLEGDICNTTIERFTNPCKSGYYGNFPDVVRFNLDADTTYNFKVRRVDCSLDPISQLFTVNSTTNGTAPAHLTKSPRSPS